MRTSCWLGMIFQKRWAQKWAVLMLVTCFPVTASKVIYPLILSILTACRSWPKWQIQRNEWIDREILRSCVLCVDNWRNKLQAKTQKGLWREKTAWLRVTGQTATHFTQTNQKQKQKKEKKWPMTRSQKKQPFDTISSVFVIVFFSTGWRNTQQTTSNTTHLRFTSKFQANIYVNDYYETHKPQNVLSLMTMFFSHPSSSTARPIWYTHTVLNVCAISMNPSSLTHSSGKTLMNQNLD